ncbi:MAG: amidohydrolase family protein [Candidatus Latescibacteria bacterium]|nr:amidohydrolase family protein [Candidatus Latescibacterota bacterium]
METIQPSPNYKRIATEEAWAPTELLDRWRTLLESNSLDDPGFTKLWGNFFSSDADFASQLMERLEDLGDRRIADMDAVGIDRQLLLLTAPGVQVFDKEEGAALAIASNDIVAAACGKHPDRFSALAAVAPQDPQAAAKEIDRAVNQLGLNGVVINSHTHGEYLDEAKFWPIFEAAEAIGAAIYIHPQTPPKKLIGSFLKYNLDTPMMGFAVEVALHTLKLILTGVFDRFPKLKIVIGHAGEGLPFWLYRLDYWQGEANLKRKISEYMRDNIYVTTSGMAWEPAILFTQQVLGADRVLYAMDYPYQYGHEEVITTDNLAISDQDKRKLYQTNAEAVFSL